MKKVLGTSSIEGMKTASERRCSFKIMQPGLSKNLFIAIITLFLLTAVIPANASTGTGKIKYVECKSKGICLSCPAFSKKYSPLVNKSHAKKSRSRRHSNPIL